MGRTIARPSLSALDEDDFCTIQHHWAPENRTLFLLPLKDRNETNAFSGNNFENTICEIASAKIAFRKKGEFFKPAPNLRQVVAHNLTGLKNKLTLSVQRHIRYCRASTSRLTNHLQRLERVNGAVYCVC